MPQSQASSPAGSILITPRVGRPSKESSRASWSSADDTPTSILVADKHTQVQFWRTQTANAPPLSSNGSPIRRRGDSQHRSFIPAVPVQPLLPAGLPTCPSPERVSTLPRHRCSRSLTDSDLERAGFSSCIPLPGADSGRRMMTPKAAEKHKAAQQDLPRRGRGAWRRRKRSRGPSRSLSPTVKQSKRSIRFTFAPTPTLPRLAELDKPIPYLHNGSPTTPMRNAVTGRHDGRLRSPPALPPTGRRSLALSTLCEIIHKAEDLDWADSKTVWRPITQKRIAD